jgi:hypothetical protein
MPRAAWCDHPRLSTGAHPPQRLKMVMMPGQCKVRLESPSWRNFLAHFGWKEYEWLVSRAETLGR